VKDEDGKVGAADRRTEAFDECRNGTRKGKVWKVLQWQPVYIRGRGIKRTHTHSPHPSLSPRRLSSLSLIGFSRMLFLLSLRHFFCACAADYFNEASLKVFDTSTSTFISHFSPLLVPSACKVLYVILQCLAD